MRLNHFRVPAAIASLALLAGTTAASASAAPATSSEPGTELEDSAN